MPSTSKKATKRRREEDPTKKKTADHQQEVLDCLLSKLSSLSVEPQHNSSGSGGSNKVSFQEKIQNLQDDRKLLLELQTSLQSLVARVDREEVKTCQDRSALMVTVDLVVRDRILGFLDEEGLWALEKSKMMDIASSQRRKHDQWLSLWRHRQNPFPDMFGIAGGAGGGPFKTDRFRYYGWLFGRASRMARRMEAMAREHYGSGSRTAAEADVPDGTFRWPNDEECDTLHFFVRITYNYDEDGARPPLVVEGFVNSDHWHMCGDIYCGVLLEFTDTDETVRDNLFERFNQIEAQEKEMDPKQYQQRLLEEKQRFGNNLSITVLEREGQTFKENPDECKLNLVISSTGFDRDDNDYFYLTPRNPCIREKHCDKYNCIRVGLGLDSYDGKLRVQLAAYE